MKTKDEARNSIHDQMEKFKQQWKENSLPTDRQILKFAHTFYERDKDQDKKHDVEMMAVVRGIVQGMQLMRQIIES